MGAGTVWNEVVMNNTWYYTKNIEEYRRETSALSLLEHGAYNTLIDECYLTQRPIPDDFSRICKMCRAATEEEQKAVEYVLCTFFKKEQNSYVHEGVVQATEKLNKLRDIGRKNAKKRWGGDSRTMESVSKIYNKELKTIVRSDDHTSLFKNFWEAYPNTGRRVNKKGALKIWQTQKLDQFSQPLMAGLDLWKASPGWVDGKYVPLVTTFLNQRRWETPPPVDAVVKDWI